MKILKIKPYQMDVHDKYRNLTYTMKGFPGKLQSLYIEAHSSSLCQFCGFPALVGVFPDNYNIMTDCRPQGFRHYLDNLTDCEIQEIKDNMLLLPKREDEMVAKMSSDAPDKLTYYTLPWNEDNEPWVHVEIFIASNESSGSIERGVQNFLLANLYEAKMKDKFALLEIQGY